MYWYGEHGGCTTSTSSRGGPSRLTVGRRYQHFVEGAALHISRKGIKLA